MLSPASALRCQIGSAPLAVAGRAGRRYVENRQRLQGLNFRVDTEICRCGRSATHIVFPCSYRRYPQGVGLASYREMDAVGRDRGRFTLMAKQCLLFPDLTEWERDFLESLVAQPPERLSTRQAEVLFEIRDENELISNIGGTINVSNLIQRAYEARLDLDEGDEEWIVAIWNRGATSLRRGHLGRLKRCCVQLGELEPYVA
jgi:hypothetical protein